MTATPRLVEVSFVNQEAGAEPPDSTLLCAPHEDAQTDNSIVHLFVMESHLLTSGLPLLEKTVADP